MRPSRVERAWNLTAAILVFSLIPALASLFLPPPWPNAFFVWVAVGALFGIGSAGGVLLHEALRK